MLDHQRAAQAIERHGHLAVLAVVMVGLVLRARGISEYWLNADEGIYYSTLTHPTFGAFWAEVTANAHPPAFYLLLRGLGYLTWDFLLLRWAPLLFGVAAIWAFWLVGRELGGPGVRGAVAGIVAATWLALSPEAVALSQVLRPYSLVVFLLAGSLVALLRYRSRPERHTLAAYAGLLSLAVLTHYSAALALGVFTLLIAHAALTRRMEGPALRDLLVAHAVPAVLFLVLYLLHVSRTLDSQLMEQAFGAGGWLDDWLVGSPEHAWRSLVTFQSFHVPPFLRVRTVILLLVAVGVSLLRRDDTVAILVTGALGLALVASVLGLYPFGPTRHNSWLTVFTIPALAWLMATLLVAPPRRALAGGAVLLVIMVGGLPLERFRGPEVSTNAMGERVLLRANLAHLVVERMEPDDSPRWVLMTEQTYNVLMPLFAADRDDVVVADDSTGLHFAYGRRRIVVARTWDWSGVDELARRVAGLTELLSGSETPPERVLVLAGGWGSELFKALPALEDAGVVLEESVAVSHDPAGGSIVRMNAMIVDRAALARMTDPAG